MTTTLNRLADEKQGNGSSQIPFALMATAYRRKKLLGDVLENTKDSLTNVVQAGVDQDQREAEREMMRCKERQDKGTVLIFVIFKPKILKYSFRLPEH